MVRCWIIKATFGVDVPPELGVLGKRDKFGLVIELAIGDVVGASILTKESLPLDVGDGFVGVDGDGVKMSTT